MNIIYILCLIFSTSLAIAKQPCTVEEFSKTISKGLPIETEQIVKRIIECNHWGGEVGDTTPERTKEIELGVKKSKCELLDKDRSSFIKLHPKLKKLNEVFLIADSWDGKCK